MKKFQKVLAATIIALILSVTVSTVSTNLDDCSMNTTEGKIPYEDYFGSNVWYNVILTNEEGLYKGYSTKGQQHFEQYIEDCVNDGYEIVKIWIDDAK